MDLPKQRLDKKDFVNILQITFYHSLGIPFAITFAKIFFLKNAIRHITIYLLTAIVLVASTGFSACCLFGCHDKQVVSGEVECCETKVANLPLDQQKNGCPDCQTKYISLDADYMLMSFDFKISLPTTAGFLSVISFSEKTITKKSATPWENNLPPPPYGKTLLPHIQSFLC